MHKPSNLMSGTWLRTQAFALTGALALIAAPVAEAGVTLSGNTYSFTGQNYVTVFDGGNVGGSYTTSQALSWTMTLTSPMGADSGIGNMSPTAWSFDDGNPAGNGTFDSSQGFAYFAAGTNGSGEIVDWLAAFVGPRLGGTTPNGSDDTGLGLSCGGLGCVVLGAPGLEAGAALLWSSKLLSQLEQNPLFGGGGGNWDTYFAGFDGTQTLALIVFSAAEVGPNIGELGGVSREDVDAAYYPAYGGAVPEPISLSLVGLGLAAVGFTRRSCRHAQRQA